MSQEDHEDAVSRRGALKLLLVPLAGIGMQRLLAACDDDDHATDASVDGQSPVDAATSRSRDAGAGGSPGKDAVASSTSSNVPWASGGTKAMQGGYPDPFASSGPGAACSLTKGMILGPCYATTLEREDISEGRPGVPMRLSFLIVRADGCTPVPEASVDIWHTGAAGVYSEFGPGTACNPGQDDVTEPKFCRGVQTTNANGRVDFSSVVPGWYAGRAVHVHFSVRVNGEEYATSQLFFDDALLDEMEQQADYKARGTRDTRNTQDFLLPADDASPFVLDFAKRADGTLHAWKMISLRSSRSEELPCAGGGLGGAPPGGIPGGAVPPGVTPPGGAVPPGGAGGAVPPGGDPSC